MNNQIKITFLLLLSCCTFGLNAQTGSSNLQKAWVSFIDKAEQDFHPEAYFDDKAIERRSNQGLPAYDWYDLPVNPAYVAQVTALSEKVTLVSRWLNCVVIHASAAQLQQIENLPFVEDVYVTETSEVLVSQFTNDESDTELMELLDRQISRMGDSILDQKGLHGEGMRIAIFDVGFSGAEDHEAFEHVRTARRVYKTWDFVKNREYVWEGGWHGTAVWSCIGGKIKGKWSGLAHEAEFLLARTEIGSREPFSEEENWVAAAEWADKNGADIINSSLGYTDRRYFPRQMNGKHAFITRGANIAAKKGILVVNAAGNEGSGTWKVIAAPADADSVFTVGGVKPCCDLHIDFSSYGPTRDLRIKPNASAQGRTACAKQSGFAAFDGTSFASPLAAGFAACVWQSDKKLSNMQLFRRLEQSASNYPFYDYAHGYGVLSAARFFETTKPAPTFTITEEKVGAEITYKVTILDEYFDPKADRETQLLYIAVKTPSGVLNEYKVIDVAQKDVLTFKNTDYPSTMTLRLSYRSYLYEINL